ncbi:unnamed protein product [Ectocarpus fasciculatus]
MTANAVHDVDGHERPESSTTGISPNTDPKPRFLGTIGNLKTKGQPASNTNEGNIVGEKVVGDEIQTGRRYDESGESEPWLRVGAPSADAEITHMAQLERELGNQPAESTADASQIPEPRHVKYATVMAKNLRRDSHRPTPRRSVDKARMTPDERRELMRAQREVMWNLQKDSIVTVVSPGDDPVPYKRQGNPDVNTPLSVKRRQALRKKPLIQEISNEYWCFPGLNPEGSDEMTKESYLKLNRKLHLALIPDTTDVEARHSAEVDWLRDTARWGGRMTRQAFGSSMFELADIWTENIDEEEYTAFLWLLLETITNTNVVPPSFKPDRDIECIVDKDLSEATKRIRDSLAGAEGRERLSVPLNTDAILAVLADSRNARGNSLSPKLKDKHIQRLRALRQRLQALKQLRTWPAPGQKGGDKIEKRSGGSVDTGGAGGVQDEGGIDVSGERGDDSLIEEQQNGSINGATERNDELLAPREGPRGDAADGRADATTEGEEEEHAVAIEEGSPSHARASVGNGVQAGEPSGSVEHGGCLETGIDAVRSVGRARDAELNNVENSWESRPTSKTNYVNSSSNHNNNQASPNGFGDRPGGDNTKPNDRRDLDARSSGTPEIGRHRHGEGASVPSSSAASGCIEENSSHLNRSVFPTKEGGSRVLGGASTTRNARSKPEETSRPGVRTEGRSEDPDSFESASLVEDQLRAGGSNKIMPNNDNLGAVRGGIHGLNGPSRGHGEGGSDKDATEYASNDGAVAAAAAAAGGDIERRGSLTNGDRREEADHAGDRNYVAASGADNRSVGGIPNLNSSKEAAIGGNAEASVDGSSEGAAGVSGGAGQSTDKLLSLSDGVVGEAVREGGTATNATQGSEPIGNLKREGDAAGALQEKQPSEGNNGGGATGEAPTKRGNSGHHSNTKDASHAKTDGVLTHHQARRNIGGGVDALPNGERLDPGTNNIPGSRVGLGRNGDSTATGCEGRETAADMDYAPAYGNLESDEPVEPENDRQSPSTGHDGEAYRTGGNERGRATAAAAASLATNHREGDHATDGVFSHEGGGDEESVHVPGGGGMSRWSLRTPSGQSAADGVLCAKREEGSLDGDLNSTTSISSGEEWRLSSSQPEDGGEIRTRGVEEQGGRGGSKGVRGGGQERRVRASGGADMGRRSDALPSADNNGHPSKRQQSSRGSFGVNISAKNHDNTSVLSKGSRGGKPLATKFRPGGGGSGGWDGISGTTDAEWEQMIQQAKTERKRRASATRPVAKQSSAARRKRSSGQVKGRKSSTGTTKATLAAQGVPSEEEASRRVAPVKTQAGDIRSWGGGGGDGQHDSTLPHLSLVDHASTGGSGASKVTKQATAAAAAQGEGGPGEKVVAPFSTPNANGGEPHQRGEDGASRVNGLEPHSAITRGQRHHADAPRVGFGGEKSGRNSDGQTELGKFTTPEMLKGGDDAKKAGGAKRMATFVGSREEDGPRNGNDGLIPQDMLAQLQPVLEKHNMTVVDVFDGSSPALDPQGSFSLDAQGRPVKNVVGGGRHTLKQRAPVAETGSSLPDSSPSGDDLDASGGGESRVTGAETAVAAVHQSTDEEEPGWAKSGEETHAARNGGAGHAPKGATGEARQLLTGGVVAHADDQRRTLETASQENGGGEFADAARRLGTVGTRRDAERKDDVVAETNTSRLPRGRSTFDTSGTTSPDQFDDQGHGFLPTGQDKLVASPGRNAAAESATDVGQGTSGTPNFNSSIDTKREGEPPERLSGPHHGYQEGARPRTRSGSRAGRMGCESTGGGNHIGIKEEGVGEGKSMGERLRNDQNGMTAATANRHHEPNRSNSLETKEVGGSLHRKGEHPMLGEPTNGRHAVQCNDVGQNSSVVGPLEGASGATSGMEEGRSHDYIPRPSSEEPLDSEGRIASSATNSFAGADDGEKTALATGSRKEGYSATLDRAGQSRGGDKDPEPPGLVPNYLVSPDHHPIQPDGSGTGDVNNRSASSGVAAMVQQHITDPPGSRSTTDRGEVLSSISVAGTKMLMDADSGGRHQQGKLGAASGRKSSFAGGKERPEILRRLSSSGVWRYDDSVNQLEEDPLTAKVSTNPSSGKLDVGDDMPATVDGRAAALVAQPAGEPKRTNRRPHRPNNSHGTSAAVGTVDQRARNPSGSSVVQNSHATSDPGDLMVDERDGIIDRAAAYSVNAAGDNKAGSGETGALGGAEIAEARKERAEGGGMRLTKEHRSWAEDVDNGDTFLDVDWHPAATTTSPVGAPRMESEDSIGPEPQRDAHGQAIAAAGSARSSTKHDLDFETLANAPPTSVQCAGAGTEGLEPTCRRTGNGEGGAKAGVGSWPVDCQRAEEKAALDAPLGFVGGSSSNGDHARMAVVPHEKREEDATARLVAMDRENLAMAVARRISDISGMGFEEALAEVRNATKGDKAGQREGRPVGVEDAMPTEPSEIAPEALRAQQARAGHATNGKTASTARTGKSPSTGNPLQRQRSREYEESRKFLPPSTQTGIQQSVSPGSHAEVRTGGQEGMVSSSPRAGEDHPYNNRVSHTHGNSDTAGLGRLRLPATGVSSKCRRRPLSGDGGKPDRRTIDDDGNGGGGRKSNSNSSTSGVRVAASGESASRVPWDMSHPKQFPDTRLRNGSFRGRIPGDAGGAFYGDEHRREMSGLAAPHNTNNSEHRLGPAEGTGARRGTGGNRSSWGAPPRDIPQRTAGRPTTAKIADDAFRNANRSRAGGENDHGAERNEPAGGGHSTGSTRSADHDPFAREQPGDRYYLPPPQRNLRQRTSQDDTGDTTNSESTPRHHDQRRKDRQERPRGVNEGERQHRTARRSRASSSSVDQRRASFSSSDRLYGQQPDDHRPMLGASEASGLSKTPDWRYGWRGGPFTTNSSSLSQEEESLPYYVDRKQVWHYVPDDGLPPWRDPGPGEPGWEPILNYCEVKPDEAEVLEERKRRDFLCDRRSRSRGGDSGDWSTTTGASSSVGGRSRRVTNPGGQPPSARPPADSSVASGMTGAGDSQGGGEGDDDGDKEREDSENPASLVEFSIARRVNARRPSTTSEKPAVRYEQRENVYEIGDAAKFSKGSSGPFAGPSDGRPQASPSIDGRSRTAKKQAAPAAAMAGAKRPRTSSFGSTGAAAAAAAAAAATPVSSSRFLRPLQKSADMEAMLPSKSAPIDTSVWPSSSGLGNTTIAAAAKPIGTAGEEEGPGVNPSSTTQDPQDPGQYSPLSFAQNPRATTAEMIRRYRGLLTRHSMPSLQPQAATALAAASPPISNDRRRQSYGGSTPWHFYKSTKLSSGFGPARRPRTSVGGSRWAQDVRLQQHSEGRSRLAPATRTAGGRWGANHGRLEALIPGEEAPAPTPITYRIAEERGPWVLDADPSLGLPRNVEQGHSLRYEL